MEPYRIHNLICKWDSPVEYDDEWDEFIDWSENPDEPVPDWFNFIIRHDPDGYCVSPLKDRAREYLWNWLSQDDEMYTHSESKLIEKRWPVLWGLTRIDIPVELKKLVVKCLAN